MNFVWAVLVICVIFQWSDIIDCKKTRHRGRRRKNRGYRQENKPNIILILADDLDVALGSPDVMRKTRKLLREGGTEFVNTFVTSSICCPSRSSILTGKYSHNHKVNSNSGPCGSTTWQAGEERYTYGKLLQDAGYNTGYFGKYLNTYTGKKTPPGWNEWYVGLRNSRYYNYSIIHNGRKERRGWNYERDYSLNVFTDAAIRFFRRAKIRDYTKPVMMTVSYAAPHGSEDPAPQYSRLLKTVKAPRDPSFNVSSPDKHWIVREAPAIDLHKEKYIDLLHRRRLLTLLSLDDAIARLYQTVRRMRQLDNTYIFFSSDHGYHLGQFRLVKGKAQPYETDIRVPMYVLGPGVPVNKTETAIALNIDLVPTFLDIAGVGIPDYVDGSSLLNVLTAKKKKRRRNMRGLPLTPWRDTFLVERTRMSFLPSIPQPHRVIQQQKISRFDPFTQLYTRLKVTKKEPAKPNLFIYCTSRNAPMPPCTQSKKRICVLANGKYSLVDCPTKKPKDSIKCVCKSQKKKLSVSLNEEELSVMAPSSKKSEPDSRRLSSSNYREYHRKLGKLADLPGDEATIFAKLLVRMKRKSRKRSQRRLTLRDLKYNELHLRIREAKRLLGALRQRKRLLKDSKNDKERDQKCVCKKEKSKVYRGKKCFHVDKGTWKTPPRWKGPDFISCTNTANNSYLCLRTINATHNFVYCKFVTGFYEYYDLNKDPYQVRNTHTSLSNDVAADLDRQIEILANCKGEKECTMTAGRRPEIIVRPPIRRNFARNRYPRGRYINWSKYLGLSK